MGNIKIASYTTRADRDVNVHVTCFSDRDEKTMAQELLSVFPHLKKGLVEDVLRICEGNGETSTRTVFSIAPRPIPIHVVELLDT